MIQFFLRRKKRLTIWVLPILVIPIALFLFLPASAAQMPNRSISITSAIPSDTTDHIFTFDMPSTSVTGSIVFSYCVNSPLPILPCVAPTGLDVSGALLTSQLLNAGFVKDIVNTTTNTFIINRTASPTTIGPSSYTLSGITNPSAANQTVFVRVTTHTSTDGSGVFSDEGSVAFSTAQSNFNVGLFVPPYLTFCTGQTVAANCSSTTGALVGFGELSTAATSAVTTQMAVATNDFDGYDLYMSGQTLTSGNFTINPLLASSSSVTGVQQFGMNLRANSAPLVGANPSGPGTGVPTADYNQPNQYKFGNGDIIAGSTTSTDFTRFTASYIANVPTDQPPGLYSTTITYIAVATF